MTNRAISLAPVRSWREYLELCKPRVVMMLVFTAVVGMFLSTPGWVPWQALIFGSLGIGLGAASGAAVNHIVDQRADSVMARTRRRPLPAGRVDTPSALVFAAILWIGNTYLFNFFEKNLERDEDTPDNISGRLWMVHGGGFYNVEKQKMPEETRRHFEQWHLKIPPLNVSTAKRTAPHRQPPSTITYLQLWKL